MLLVSNQSMYIKWRSIFSGNFHVTNGVRQGGVLSPLLFNVYVDELSDCLNKSGIGGSMNGTIINHMLYADDICIISLFSAGLQQLTNICSGIVLVKCLFPEVFQYLLNCFAHLFTGLHNELNTVQIVLVVLHYYL